MSMATAAHRLLRWLPPERAHRVATWGMRRRFFAPGAVPWSTGFNVAGHVFPNPLGLAAGFDKAGVLVDAAPRYGFGWIEVGSVTWQAHEGNAGTRMFRAGRWDIFNRMGLNGPGAEVVRENLIHAKSPHYGISITKSNKPDIVGERGIEDIVRTVACLNDLGVYHVLNLSCPNSHADSVRSGTTVTFEDPALLRELLPHVRDHLSRPWGVKLSPHRSKVEMDATLAACEENGCWFYVLGNTLPAEYKGIQGGRSGQALLSLALPRVRWLARVTRKPVVGCGGAFLGEHGYLYELAGAAGVQVYNGFVRGPISGPAFAHDFLRRWDNLRQEGFEA